VSDSEQLAQTKAILALQQSMQQSGSEASDDGKKSNTVTSEAEVIEPRVPEASKATSENPPWETPPLSEHSGLQADKPRAAGESANNAASKTIQDESLKPYLENGDKLIYASQIDAWSNTIESLNVGGLIKQTALHSTYHKVDSEITLTMHNSQEHLLNDSVQQQLQGALSEVLQQTIQLTIELGEPSNTPFELQQRIQNMRLAHATDIANTDTSVQQLIHSFNASVIPGSIKPE
jgi:DNA polymerase-3 subunit gamma/tau